MSAQFSIGETVRYLAWQGLVQIERAGVVEGVIIGCGGAMLKLADGPYVQASCLVTEQGKEGGVMAKRKGQGALFAMVGDEEFEQATRRIADLEDELKETEKKRWAAEYTIDELKRALGHRSEELSAALERAAELIDARDRELNEARARVAELEAQLNNQPPHRTVLEAARLQGKVAELERDNKLMRDQLVAITDDTLRVKAELMKAQNLAVTSEERARRLENELSSTHEMVVELTKRNKSLRAKKRAEDENAQVSQASDGPALPPGEEGGVSNPPQGEGVGGARKGRKR